MHSENYLREKYLKCIEIEGFNHILVAYFEAPSSLIYLKVHVQSDIMW